MVETSEKHGFFDEAFSLTLQTATPEAVIYYTYDGSIPGPGNGSAHMYEEPIVIDRTTAFRAAAYKEEYGPSPVTTQTYVFLEDVLTQTIDISNPENNPFGLVYATNWGGLEGNYNMNPSVVATWDDFNPANDLVFQSFVVNLNVVIGAEVALGVIVDVEVDPAPYGPPGSQVHLVVEPRWLEAAATPGVGVEQQGRATALVAEAVGTQLQSDLAVESKVGILRGESQDAAAFPRSLSALGAWLLHCQPVQGKVAQCRGTFHPGGVEHCTDRAVPCQAPQGGRQPGGSQPRGAQCRWFLQGKRRDRKGSPKADSGRIRPTRNSLAGQNPRKRDKAD
jgi:hypothetical protein